MNEVQRQTTQYQQSQFETNMQNLKKEMQVKLKEVPKSNKNVDVENQKLRHTEEERILKNKQTQSKLGTNIDKFV
jgi:23S rRNA pseudoU1915 N3-methylase RlmH